MAGRRLKPGWIALAAVALGALAWLGLPRLLARLEFFRVRRVELVGLRHDAPERLLEAMALPERLSVFDDLDPYAERLRALPGLAQVQVGRRLPGALRVLIREVTPVALAPVDGRLAMVSGAGAVLPFEPTRRAPDLPVLARPDSTVAAVLGRLREVDPEFFGQVGAAARVDGDVALEVGRRRVWLRPEASAEVMRAVMTVAEVLAREGRAYDEIDGRYSSQVVVRTDRRRGGAV